MINTVRNYARRTYLVNKGLQTKFIIGFSSAVFLGFVFNLFVVYFLIDRELTGELYKIHLKIRTTSDIAVPIILKLGAITIPSILIVSAIIGYLLTRRIELPLLTFKDAVRATAGGDFTGRLSSGLPTALPEDFNRMSESLGASFSSLKGPAAELEGCFDRLSPAGGGPLPSRAEIKEALQGITAARERMTLGLTRFKV